MTRESDPATMLGVVFWICLIVVLVPIVAMVAL
jgi:hypothetical protein